MTELNKNLNENLVSDSEMLDIEDEKLRELLKSSYPMPKRSIHDSVMAQIKAERKMQRRAKIVKMTSIAACCVIMVSAVFAVVPYLNSKNDSAAFMSEGAMEARSIQAADTNTSTTEDYCEESRPLAFAMMTMAGYAEAESEEDCDELVYDDIAEECEEIVAECEEELEACEEELVTCEESIETERATADNNGALLLSDSYEPNDIAVCCEDEAPLTTEFGEKTIHNNDEPEAYSSEMSNNIAVECPEGPLTVPEMETIKYIAFEYSPDDNNNAKIYEAPEDTLKNYLIAYVGNEKYSAWADENGYKTNDDWNCSDFKEHFEITDSEYVEIICSANN